MKINNFMKPENITMAVIARTYSGHQTHQKVLIVKKICCENYANKEGAMLSNYLR